jgi:hypothetical protein
VVAGSNLDRHGMDDAIREFGRKLEGADLALFFYAGHGLQVGGKNYLVPVDAKLEPAGDLALDAVDIRRLPTWRRKLAQFSIAAVRKRRSRCADLIPFPYQSDLAI